MIKEIEGFKDYFIGDDGTVYTAKSGEMKPMKTKRVSKGYEGINLYQDGKHHTKLVHRLVAEAFIPNEDNLPEINHKDGDKFNNNIENLEWCTVSYNRRHCRRELGTNKNLLIVIENGVKKEYDFCILYSEEKNIKYSTLMNVLNRHRSKPREWNDIVFIYKGVKI